MNAEVPTVRVYTCKKCKKAYMVPELDKDIHLLQKSMRCPNADVCNSRIRIYATTNIPIGGAERLSALALYQAVMGAGLPGEKKCSPKDVRKYLLGSTIVDVNLDTTSDPRRSIIFSLTLQSGKVLHFAPSIKGATVYKVTEVANGR